MPLIIVTGLPCSGKTHRAQQIATSLTEFISSSTDPTISKRTVQIIPSQHALSDPDPHSSHSVGPEPRQEASLRDQIYTSAAEEKTARAAEFSAVKRALGRDNVVVADALNYIKGYRYQLWCEAKAAGTRCCVVHVAAREDECAKWNADRGRAWGFKWRSEGELDGVHVGDEQRAKIQGENVLGELIPESHTAIYGDRGVHAPEGQTSRSRSSSLDGLEGDVSRPRQLQDETMTLKSLYIRDREEVASVSARPSPPSTATATPTTTAGDPPPSPGVSVAMPTSPPPSTASPPYSPSTLSSLCMRYEPPSPFSRWDTPLFVVPSTDVSPPMKDIWAAIYPPPPNRPTSKKALSQLARPPQTHATDDDQQTSLNPNAPADGPVVKPHAATVLPRATGADALQTLESATMDVVKQLLAQSRAQNPAILQGEGGDVDLCVPVSVPGSISGQRAVNSGEAQDQERDREREHAHERERDQEQGQGHAHEQERDSSAVRITLHVPPGVNLNQPILQRLRRKYTQIQRGGIAHGQGYVTGKRAVVEGFVRFLADEWDADD
ncbi:hypothetical protein PV04_10183 [Phialophora macrospora]|uniref:Protein KTI12 n=1 Tax=Phialophora macrospora TaxID=1851006 RepID=A0A0D2FTE1_9EURO|nr:hypothetical protein PV04_10183 [Phialophora macrospora]